MNKPFRNMAHPDLRLLQIAQVELIHRQLELVEKMKIANQRVQDAWAEYFRVARQ